MTSDTRRLGMRVKSSSISGCASIGDRFNHNLHALRIVEQFEQRYLDYPGLNLTFEVREGIVKHSRDYSAAEFPELAEYLLDERPPLEAQLIDLVDEIAYNTADLDDGFEAHLLDFEQLRAEVPIFDAAYVEVDRAHPSGLQKLKFNEALKRVLDRLATDLIEHTRGQVEASGANSVEDIRRWPKRLASFSAEVAAQNGRLKRFLFHAFVFACRRLRRIGTARLRRWMRCFVFFWSIRSGCRNIMRNWRRRAAASRGLRLHCGDDGSFSCCGSAGN